MPFDPKTNILEADVTPYLGVEKGSMFTVTSGT